MMDRRAVFGKAVLVPGTSGTGTSTTSSTRKRSAPKELAEQVYAKRVAQIAEGKFFPDREIRRRRHPLKEFLAKFVKEHVTGKLKNADHEERYSRTISAALGTRDVRSLTKDDVAEYVTQRKADGLEDSPVNRELSFLRKAMNHAVAMKLADQNPIGGRHGGHKLAKENNVRVRYLSDDEETRLHEAIGDIHWPLVEFAIHTGLRQANQFNLPWTDVDFTVGIITVRNPKGGEDYRVPMNSTVKKLLAALPSRLKLEFVFPSSTGTAMGSQNFLHRVFVPALARAKITDFHWHDLRHTFASRLVMAGVPLLTVSKLMGHATPTMTLRYAHLAPGHLADAVRNLDGSAIGTRSGTDPYHEKRRRRTKAATT